MIQVRAKSMVYYNHRRQREGSVFFIASEKEFSKTSMEKLGKEPKGLKNKPVPKVESSVLSNNNEEVI